MICECGKKFAKKSNHKRHVEGSKVKKRQPCKARIVILDLKAAIASKDAEILDLKAAISASKDAQIASLRKLISYRMLEH